MKKIKPIIGDSLIIKKDGSYFIGYLSEIKRCPPSKKNVYTVHVMTVYPDIAGRLDSKLKNGDIVDVEYADIKEVHSEEVDKMRPEYCITIENGMLVDIKRCDGSIATKYIKVIDNDDNMIKLFEVNATSCEQIREIERL